MSLESAILAMLMTQKSSLYEKYPNVFNYEANPNITTQNTYQTFLSITGAGYLRSAFSTCAAGQIRITIDGVVTEFICANSSSPFPLGFLTEADVQTDSYPGVRFPTTWTKGGNINGSARTYGLSDVWGLSTNGHTTGTAPSVVLSEPLLFKSQLLVEIASQNTSYANNLRVTGAHAQ